MNTLRTLWTRTQGTPYLDDPQASRIEQTARIEQKAHHAKAQNAHTHMPWTAAAKAELLSKQTLKDKSYEKPRWVEDCLKNTAALPLIYPLRRLQSIQDPQPFAAMFKRLPARVNKIGKIENRGKVLKLSDKVTLTRPFTARKKIGRSYDFFVGYQRYNFFKITYNFKKTLV